MTASSPQLDAPRRERIEAALDIAQAALRRIAGPTSAEAEPGSAGEIARTALVQIEAIVPEKAPRR
jgi:hypothetical protein